MHALSGGREWSLAECREYRNETMPTYSFISWQQHSGPWVRCVKLFLKEAAYIIEALRRVPSWSCQVTFISKAEPFVIKFKLTLCTLNLNFRALLTSNSQNSWESEKFVFGIWKSENPHKELPWFSCRPCRITAFSRLNLEKSICND